MSMANNYDEVKPLDLSSLDTTKACDNGAEIELVHPTTRKGLGQFISIVGKDSKIFRDHIAETANAERRKQFAAKRRGKEAEIETFEETQEKGTELLVACTTGFRNVFVDGAPLSFSPENAHKLYSKFAFVRTQIDEAIADLENFIKS